MIETSSHCLQLAKTFITFFAHLLRKRQKTRNLEKNVFKFFALRRKILTRFSCSVEI